MKAKALSSSAKLLIISFICAFTGVASQPGEAHTPSNAPATNCEDRAGGSQPASERQDSDGDGVPDGTDSAPFDPQRSAPCANPNVPGSRPITIPIQYAWRDLPYGVDVRYDMTARTDPRTGRTTYRANLKVNLTGDRNPAREAAWKACVEEFWKGGEVEVGIDFVTSGGYQTVNVNAGSGRSNAGEWFAGDANFNCNVVRHEVAHLLGLPDEYCDPADPDRWIGERDSIMRVTWDTDGKPPRNYPRHFQRMIADYQCPPTSGQQSFDRQRPGFFERLWDAVLAATQRVADRLNTGAGTPRPGPTGTVSGGGTGPAGSTGANVGRNANTNPTGAGTRVGGPAQGAGMAGALGRD